MAKIEIKLKTRISGAGCSVWLSILLFTAQIVQPQVAIRVPDEDLDVREVDPVNGETSLATTKGAYWLSNGQVARIPNEDLVVRRIARAGDFTWIATTNGAYRIAQRTVTRVPDQVLNVLTLAPISGSRICLGTASGAYISNGDQVYAIGPPDTPVHEIEAIDGTVWLATDRGAYRLNSLNKAERISIDTGLVNSITSAQGSIWVAAERGAFRFAGQTIAAYAMGLNVTRVTEINGAVWLATNRGAYRITGRQIERIPDIEMAVADIVGINGSLWLASNRGAYKIDNNQVSMKLPDRDLAVKSIALLGNNLWLTSYHGAFLYRDSRLTRIPDVDLDVQHLSIVNGALWMATTQGAYRMIDLSISLTLTRGSPSLQTLIDSLTPAPLVMAGEFFVKATYTRPDGTPVESPELSRPNFRVVAASDDDALDAAIRDNKYSPADIFIHEVSSGKRTISLSVVDRWGNSARKRIVLWVFPGPLLVGVITSAFWLLVLAGSIAFAPSNEFVNDLLMNPWVRGVSSFGLIPLVLTTVPSVRRHILKRYMRTLLLDPAISQWLSRYEVPDQTFEPKEFGRRLSEERVIQITGRSGIGKTSYLRFLTASYGTVSFARLNLRVSSVNSGARPDSTHAQPGGVVPVFVPLVRYRGQKTEDMVAAQLSSYGRLSDKQLAIWYTQQGGFLFLLDGLNEVDEATRSDVNRFIDEGRRRSYFCISSQEPYPAFAWVAEVRLAYLSPEAVKKIIRSRLDPSKATAALTQFGADTYALYKVPQDLEFLIQLTSENGDVHVPQTKSLLYETVLAPVFSTWREEGRADYHELLVKRAFEMVATKDPVLNPEGPQVMAEFVNPLLARKLLVQRESYYYFQHNLIRDYLASLWLRSRWRSILSDATVVIDSNWLEMLRLMLGATKVPHVCKEVVETVMRKNRSIAGDLFNYLEVANPSSVGEWGVEFKVRYADTVIGEEGRLGDSAVL
jgi:hypothetical protein